MTGKKIALPTEAQWEYACRAGTGTAYCFGDDASKLGDYAWYRKNAWLVDERYVHLVGQKKPNAWGLYDMHGNVTEWCRDLYDKRYYAKGKHVDPENTTEPKHRVVRGGTWYDYYGRVRSAYRDHQDPSERYYCNGFRVVVELDSSVN